MYVGSGKYELVVKRPAGSVGDWEQLATVATVFVVGLAAISLAGIVLIVKAVKD